jgi:WD40 repeat protein
VKNTLGDVVVLEADNLQERLRLPGRTYGEGSGVRFSPCGDMIVDGSWNGDLLVRDAASGDVLLHEHDGMITTLDTTNDRMTWLYTQNDAGIVVRRWPFTEHAPIRCVTGGDLLFGGGSTAAISNDGRFVAASTWEQIETWQREGERLEPLATYSVPSTGTGSALAWNPDGTALAYAGGGQALVLTSDLRLLWVADFRYASDVAFSPSGDLLAVGDWSSGAVVATSIIFGVERDE